MVDTRELIDARTAPRVSLTRFGVVMDSALDQSTAVQSALDSGEALWVPQGEVSLGDGVELPTNANVQGAGPGLATLKALPGATDDLVTIAEGQIRWLTLRDFGVSGLAGNTGQRGLVFVARPDGGGNGGVWDALIENIRIRGFDGVSMAWLGYTTLGIAPHQFISMRRVSVERAAITSAPVLYMHGQVEHVHFDGCRFDGPGYGTPTYDGQNIYIGRSKAASEGLIGAYDGSGTALSDIAPKQIKFTDLICQAANQAIVIDRSENIDFDVPWFEDNKNTMLVQNSARVSVWSPRCANAATQATTGAVFRSNSSSEVLVDGRSFITGTNTKFLQTDGAGSILPKGLSGSANVMDNVWHDRTISSTETTQIDLGGVPGAHLNITVAGVTLSQISSSLSPGEILTITLRAGNSITLSNSGSGTLGFNLGNGVTSLTVNVGDTLHFRKSQRAAGKGWDLISKL